ncbi:MAG TPA: DMT family transporter [Gaiellaceae bacterium]|nr:DMT family transporter [Gaiellaceae bacterium]
MRAVLLALGAGLSYGVGDFLGGLSARRARVLTVLALSQATGAVAVGAWAFAEREPFLGVGAVAAAGAAGVCGVVGLGALYRGMAVGAMGVVAPISSVAAAIPFAYGVARGERPSLLQFVGVLIALGGLALVSRSPGARATAVAAGVGLALIAAVGFGLYFVFLDEAASESVPWTVLVARLTSLALVLALVAASRTTLRPGPLLVPILAVGLCDVSANVLFALATTRGLLSIVSVLTSLYPAVTVALAAVVLRERVTGMQLAGAAAVLAGAALISAG